MSLGWLFTGSNDTGDELISEEYAFNLSCQIRFYAGLPAQPILAMVCTTTSKMCRTTGFSESLLCIGGHCGGNLTKKNQLRDTREYTLAEGSLHHTNLADAEHSGCVAEMVATLADGPITTHVYVFGGYNGETRLDTVQEYDVQADTWRTASSYGKPLWGGNIAAHAGTSSLWCVGGYDGNIVLNTTRIYTPGSDSWQEGPPMLDGHNSGTCAFIGDTLFRAGGQSSNFQYSASAECLNTSLPTEEQTWEKIAALPERRYRVGGAMLREEWYLVGGVCDVALRSCLRYDATADVWLEIAPMNRPRIGAGVAVLNGQLVAFGGFDSSYQGALRSTECYDPREGKWRDLNDLPTKLDGPGLCSVVRWANFEA